MTAPSRPTPARSRSRVTGRPLAEARWFAIRRGRADSLDLGTLLGRPDLRTGINARFTGAMTSGSADSMQARLAVELLPSHINKAQLNGGRVGLELEPLERCAVTCVWWAGMASSVPS